jgi:predicted RNase H-like nuclease (RuvC/YqgF family)
LQAAAARPQLWLVLTGLGLKYKDWDKEVELMRDSVDAEKVIKKLGEQIGMLTVQMAMLETKLTEAKETIAKYESEQMSGKGRKAD